MKKKKMIFITLAFALLLLPFIVKASTSGGADSNAIRISINCPVIGQKPTYVQDKQYTTQFDEMWVNETDHKQIGSNDVFESGKRYSYRYGYILNPNYEGKYLSFGDTDYFETCQYALGGTGGGDQGYSSGSIGFYIGNRDEYEWQEMENAILDINSPILGGQPPHARNNSKYSILSEKWINDTDKKEMKSTDVFEANKKYKYVLTYSTFYGVDRLFDNFESNMYYLGRSYDETKKLGQDQATAYFYFGDTSNLVIDGTATIASNNTPMVGQTLPLPELTIDAPIVYSDMSWSVIDEENPYGKWISNPSKTEVQAGKTYKLRLSITLEPGYNFGEDFKVINNNKNGNFVDEYLSFYGAYNDPKNTRKYLSYEATYTVLEDGQTIGIKADSNGSDGILYPNWGRQYVCFPDNEYNETVNWTSSNEDVAVVSSDGYVSALTPGTAVITATNKKGDSATVTITVGIPAQEVVINKTSVTMYVGDEETLSAIVLPETATDRKVYWGIEYKEGMNYNDQPISLNYDTGKIIGTKAGKINVYASSASGAKATCEVTVLEREIESISLNRSSSKIEVGGKVQLTETILPENATDKNVIWISSNPDIASVNNGLVTGLKRGTTTITVQTKNNKTATCEITVAYKTGWYVENGDTYYYDDGVLQKGIVEIDGSRYLLGITSGKLYRNGLATITSGETAGTYLTDKDGKVKTGFQEYQGDTYYFNKEGKMQKGITDVDENRYLLGITSGKLYRNGLATITSGETAGTYLTDKDGKVKTGFQEYQGDTYYFNDKGVMQKGITDVDGSRYLLGITSGKLYRNGLATITSGETAGTYLTDKDGKVKTGFQEYQGDTYYFNDKGVMQKGITEVDGNRYLLGITSGKLYRNGLATITSGDTAGTYITDENGQVKTGFQSIGSDTYYFNEKGVMQKGITDVDGNRYLLGITTGKLYKNGLATITSGDTAGTYLTDENGQVKTGFQSIGSDTYYFNNKGVMQKGITDVDGNKYLLGITSGKLYKNGLATITSGNQAGTYITDENGKVQTGWIDYKGQKYYADESGKLLNGVHEIDGKAYLFGVTSYKLYKNGLATTPDNKTYYADAEGVLQKGKIKINGKEYNFGNDYALIK